MTSETPPNSDRPHNPDVERVPEFWPPADPIEPVQTRRIPWPLAPLAAIPAVLAPRRFGPYLANSSWLAAYLVHLLFALLTIGALYAILMENFVPGRMAPERILHGPIAETRRALAGAVLFFFSIWNAWFDVALTLLVAAIIETAIWAGAVLLVPLYAAGEGAKRTYTRCVKLLLWSTACQALLCWAFMHVMIWFERKFSQRVLDEASIACLALLELWWISVLFRLGGRYGGPKNGPRWRPRRPRCENCGYSLVSLPLDGRCPECNTLVRNSLPERRKAPAFAKARGLRARRVGFARTLWAALFARRFAENVAVWSSLRAARNFAALTCTLVGVITTVSAFYMCDCIDDDAYRAGALWGVPIAYAAVAISCGVIGGMLAAVWILVVGLFLSRFGFRDVADRAVIIFYSSAWLFVLVLLADAGVWTAYWHVHTWGPFGSLQIGRDMWIDLELVVWLTCLLPSFVVLVMSFNRVRVMLRCARYANA